MKQVNPTGYFSTSSHSTSLWQGKWLLSIRAQASILQGGHFPQAHRVACTTHIVLLSARWHVAQAKTAAQAIFVPFFSGETELDQGSAMTMLKACKTNKHALSVAITHNHHNVSNK